jgi:hypothetical protein
MKQNERSVRSYIDLKRDSESTVRSAEGNEFQQSMDLLKKEDRYLVCTMFVWLGVRQS